MTSSTVTDVPQDGALAPAATLGSDRKALGAALEARSGEIATEVAAHFPEPVRAEVEASARLSTESVGRWLATGSEFGEHERRVHARRALQAVLVESDLSTAVRGRLAWRDLCCAALTEDAERLGVADAAVDAARSFVQSSCDGGLVRTARAFNERSVALHERLRNQQADFASHALHDDLTGLPNRVLLTDRIQRAALAGDRRTSRSMLLVLGLDGFTAINDRFGHPAGDALLVEVARRLLELVRGTDTVARLGGDEFVILVEDTEEPEAVARSLAERIHQSMCGAVALDDRELHASVSIGITEVTPGADPETVLVRGDAALHVAKRGGPERYATYDVAIGAEHRRETKMADELRVAHGRGELSLDYQPLFRLAGGSPGGLTGMEALLRWDHPERGRIEPDEFVPLLEQSRQIVPVGRWVLEEAASQCAEWQRRWPDLDMSVNVSARQLHDPGFVDDVGDALQRSGLDPAHFVLEVTESVLVVDIVRLEAVMQSVRDLGVRMALDDFGTGYSSLLHLQGLPIDRLKVDRTFVSGLDATGHDGAVIQTVVDLAHKLSIAVVAEGVETVADLRSVGALGCDEAQGALLGPPVPAHLQTFEFSHRAPSWT